VNHEISELRPNETQPGRRTMKTINMLVLIVLMSGLGCHSTRSSSTGEPCSTIFANLEEAPRMDSEVDVPAKPVGGLRAVQRRIQYPRAAMREGVWGEVLVQFVVNKRGCVMQAEVIREVDVRLDAEALRVIRASRFEPAQEAGEAVAVVMTMPIGFYVRL
jgi:TonB family protein